MGGDDERNQRRNYLCERMIRRLISRESIGHVVRIIKDIITRENEVVIELFEVHVVINIYHVNISLEDYTQIILS